MLVIFGLFFIIFGILSFHPTLLISLIRFNNSVAGVKTKITPTTIMFHRMGGVISILIGVFIILMQFNGSDPTGIQPNPFSSANIEIQHFDKPITP